MAHSQRRRAKTPPKLGGMDIAETGKKAVSNGDLSNLGPAAVLASQCGVQVADSQFRPSPALDLQAQLEAELVSSSVPEDQARLPLIYGLSIALAFSLVSWYAIASLIGYLLT
jgi:hypothetical protein